MASRVTCADSDDEDSFVDIAERKMQLTDARGRREVVRTAQPPSVADVRDVDTTVSECPVCANPMKETLTTPCGHVFCKRCILLWLKQQSTCPLCREQCRAGQLSAKPSTGKRMLRCYACHMVSFAVIPDGTKAVKCPVCEHRIDLLKARRRYCCA